MYFIISKDGKRACYLYEDIEYTVGRKDCNILIKNDTSISRKHASLIVEGGKLKITDLGAKYKTFINNVELEPKMPTKLDINDQIKFGIMSSCYIVNEQKIIVSSSGLGNDEKKLLTEYVKCLNGELLTVWSRQCTHINVREIMLTLKILCALIQGQPMVTLNFWRDFLENIRKEFPPPNPTDYKPVYSESILNKNINLDYIEERKSLFVNKIFVFKTKILMAKIEHVIKLAGGICICWKGNEIPKEKFLFNNPQYILVQDDQKVAEDDSFMKMVGYLHSIGKRSIPFQEIAMAVVLASCEKECNPHFDRTGILIKPTELVYTEISIPPDTQTQQNEIEEKHSIVVPQTIDSILNDPDELQSYFTQRSSKKTSKKQDNCSMGSKRTGQELNSDEKRMRLDKHDNPGATAHDISEVIPETVDDDILHKVENNIDESNKMQDEHVNTKRAGHQDQGQTKKIKLDSSVSEKKPLIEIVTSTQILPSTSKSADQREKSENPFGFKRMPVSRNDATRNIANVSEFFKPFSKSHDRTGADITNISTIDIDAPSTTEKRKLSRDSCTNENTKKQRLLVNPFAPTAQSKRNNVENGNPFKKVDRAAVRKSTTSNPFTDIGKNCQAKKTKANKADAEHILPKAYIFNITVVDSQMEKNYAWLTKDTIVKCEADGISKNTTEMDERMQKVAESFNNCVIVEKKSLIVNRTALLRSSEASNSNKTNFKKFKKVQPVHFQTNIIPRDGYVGVICNEKEVIDHTFFDDI